LLGEKLTKQLQLKDNTAVAGETTLHDLAKLPHLTIQLNWWTKEQNTTHKPVTW
jgi:hypothetical protein